VGSRKELAGAWMRQTIMGLFRVARWNKVLNNGPTLTSDYESRQLSDLATEAGEWSSGSVSDTLLERESNSGKVLLMTFEDNVLLLRSNC